jgi:microcystin synthetase protein McyA
MSDLSRRIATLSPERRLLLELLRQQRSIPEPGAHGETAAREPRPSLAPFSLISPEDRAKIPEGIEDAFPLTMVQSGMLSHMELQQDADDAIVPPAYHNVNSWYLQARLDPELFERAVQQVVDRHSMLRTSFDLTTYSEPLQLIHRHARLPIVVEDLRHLGLPAQEELLAEFILRENQALMDLSRPPLMRFHVHLRSDDRFQLTLTEPHSVSDGWSTSSTLAEIFRRYLAMAKGEPLPEEAPPPMVFREFAYLERQALDSAETREFWNERLKDHVLTRLPRWPEAFRRTSKRQSHKLYFGIEPRLVRGLHRFARLAGVSLKSTTFAVHLKVLSLISGESEVTSGLVFNGRPEESGGTDVRGLFLNTLPVRVRLGGDSWKELARKALEAEIEILPHRRFPLGALQKAWGGDAIFEAAFGYLQFHGLQPMLATGDIKALPFENSDLSITHFPLMVIFELSPDSDTQMRMVLEYDLEELCEQQMRPLFDCYRAVLSAMVAAPDELHGARSFLGEPDRRRLAEWNDSVRDYPAHLCTHQLFERQAALTPESVAAVCGERRISYRELDREANQVAHRLRALGVGPETRVGLCVERTLELPAGLLGILKAGGAYVPLDPALPQERLAFILNDAGVRVLLTTEKLAGRFQSADLTVLRLDGDRGILPSIPANPPEVAVWPENPAYVIYTSGSTGRPKGVVIPHRGLTNYLCWCTGKYEVAAGDGAPVHSSISFDLTVTSLLSPLLAGRSVFLLPDDPSGETLSQAMAAEDFSLVKLTPAHLELLRHRLSPQEAARTRALVIGGEALTGEALSFWTANAPGTRLFNEYGPTETVVGCSVHEVPGGEEISGPVPIGRPAANARLYVLDSYLLPALVGTPGEICIGGDGLARGYLGQPALTAEKFIPAPFDGEAGSRLYRTGDLGRHLPDGNLEFLGRIDHQVKVRGYRIELGEIESVLAQHPDLRGAAVLLREDTPGDRRLVAYAATGEGPGVDAGVLRSFLAARLPEYMIPSAFVFLESLPLTPNGKIDRRALPVPTTQSKDAERPYVAPRNEPERVLAAIWEQILGCERVSVHDNFFELGGDSIRGLLSVTKAKRAGLQLSSRQLFQYPTIAELAAASGASPRALRAERPDETGPAPLTPIQQWFFERELADPNHFNQAVLLETRGAWSPGLLARVAGRLIEHHDALRTRFQRTEQGWGQTAAEPSPHPPFCLVDLSGLPAGAWKSAIEGSAAQLQRGLDIERGRLLRIALFHLGEKADGRLLVISHHLVIDGVSWRLLLEDLQTAYRQLQEGLPVALPPKTSAFGRWARRLAAFARSEAVSRELAYWSSELSRDFPVLPQDIDAGAGAAGLSTTLSRWLSAGATAPLVREAGRVYEAQFHELLLTALAMTLKRWIGHGPLLVDLEGHGREEILEGEDVSRTIGWFTTIFPVALNVFGTDLPAAVRRVREQLRGVPNRGIGYGLLRYGGSEDAARKLRALPQAEVSFNYLGQLDNVLPAPDAFNLARESAGPLHDPRAPRSYLLEVGAQVVAGELRVDWTYGDGVHRQATIEALADDFFAVLDALKPEIESRAGEPFEPRRRLGRRELDLALEEAEFEG